ncbi:MAG: DegQ family serine endoprotease [Gammaproteobacteria bacterium]|nr:DegQ family serine endoprotease [Gammaproteobacteria bacterium]
MGKQLPSSLAPMLQNVIQGVVNIAIVGKKQQVQANPFLDDPMFKRFFNIPQHKQPQQRQSKSLGSGVIVDAKNGYIITNNHVIAESEEINVTLRSGKQYKAKVIGTDKESDLAVIQIKAKDLTAVPMISSDNLRVGDFVVAIGNPFGLGQTVTSGIVSALGRSGLGIESYEDFIQTDASINPGNSGGALVNLRGELIGINTAILSRSGANIGIGFAIPTTMVKKIMTQLITHGEIRRGRLGVYIQDLTPELARAFNIKDHKGAVVSRVASGSPAEKAGIHEGDIIISLDSKEIRNASSLRNTVGLLPIGKKVKLGIMRDGKQIKINAVIGEPQEEKQNAEDLNEKLKGAVLGELEENHPLFGKVEGVVILSIEPNSPAGNAGLQQGDVITSINRMPVKNLKDLKAAVKQKNDGILLNIRRGNGGLYLLLQ